MTCSVLGGAFAILLQGLLACLTLAVLVYKKYKEVSSRTWSEFALDSSKQVMGAGWIHVANLICALLWAEKLPGVDSCTWYAANILVDTTLGVAVEWALVEGLRHLLQKLPKDYEVRSILEPGNYYAPGTKEFRPTFYVFQLVVWLLIVTAMKVSMVMFMQAVPVVVYSVNFVLTRLQDMPRTKLFTVMICIPLMMNTLQFVITDNFIKKRKTIDEEAEVELRGLPGPGGQWTYRTVGAADEANGGSKESA